MIPRKLDIGGFSTANQACFFFRCETQEEKRAKQLEKQAKKQEKKAPANPPG